MTAELADLTIDARCIVPVRAPGLPQRDHSLIVRDGRIVALPPRSLHAIHMMQLVFAGGRAIVTAVWAADRQLLADSWFTRLARPRMPAVAAPWAAELPLEGDLDVCIGQERGSGRTRKIR